MATTKEVLTMLCPAGGWIIVGDDFDNITWVDDRPRCTKEEFAAGFEQFDAWKADQEVKALTAKQAAESKLANVNLSIEELKAVLA